MVPREMEFRGSGDKLANVGRDSPIFRRRGNPEGKTGRHRAPPSLLVPGSALGSCRHGARPCAQAMIHRKGLATTCIVILILVDCTAWLFRDGKADPWNGSWNL
jgi:hypothetical protein